VLVVPWEGQKVPIFDRPSKMVVLLARSGIYGLRLIGVENPGEGK
jgi:hypothetical protein